MSSVGDGDGDGWNETTLGELADYVNGYAFKPADWQEQGLPIVRIAQLTDPAGPCDRYAGRLPEKYLINDGDLIFSWSATLMTTIWDRGPAYVNQHLFKVVPRPGTDLSFLHHLLDFEMDALAGQAHGTTMRHIKRSDLLPFPVVVPRERFQREIAAILDSLDDAIRRAHWLLAKLNRLGVGLVHDLLTRGIGKTGELRDSARWPDHFRETPLGPLPKAWETVSVRALVEAPLTFIQTGPFGSQLHASDYVATGVPVVMPQDIVDGTIDVSRAARIDEAKADSLGRHRMIDGDVVFARRGDLSKCAPIAEANQGWLCGTGCLLLRPPGAIIRPEWLAAVYRHDMCQRQIAAMAVGSTMVNLNSSILGALTVPLPSPNEQEQILEIAATHRRLVEAAERELAKLQLVKEGLAADLLTGRVHLGLDVSDDVLAAGSVG